MIKIYIGNLSWGTTDDGLKKAFERFGSVNYANVARYRDTGRSRGFGFVEMEEEPARRAINEMNGAELDGRVLKVREARTSVHRGNRVGRRYHRGRGYCKSRPHVDRGNGYCDRNWDCEKRFYW